MGAETNTDSCVKTAEECVWQEPGHLEPLKTCHETIGVTSKFRASCHGRLRHRTPTVCPGHTAVHWKLG